MFKRLVDFLLTVAAAVAAGVLTAIAGRELGFPEWLGASGIVVDAVTGALGSGISVYIITTLYVVAEIKAEVRQSIFNGFVGDLSIPNLARAVHRKMTKLAFLSSGKSVFLPLQRRDEFKKQLDKVKAEDVVAVALSITAGDAAFSKGGYTADDFVDALGLMRGKYEEKFTHIIVRDASEKSIVAAYSVDQISFEALRLLSGDLNMAKLLLEFVRQEVFVALGIFFNFAVDKFNATSTSKELFADFARERVPRALLTFDSNTVVGVIELWQLVELALEEQDKANSVDQKAARTKAAHEKS